MQKNAFVKFITQRRGDQREFDMRIAFDVNAT